MSLTEETHHYDFVVIGGGLSGMLAAIEAARHGVRTALINNRPMLGGNASSEIKMHICGADHHAERTNARETGILEDLLLTNKYRNATTSFHLFDTIMWEAAQFQPGLELFLNTHITQVTCIADQIQAVQGVQLTTEKQLTFTAPLFLDATGDGMVGALAGAEYMAGRESRETFDEPWAPAEADDVLMGNSLMFTAVDTGKPVHFSKPEWAYTYTEEDLKSRYHAKFDSGYWWIELSGDGPLSTITQFEDLRTELLKVLYGIWNHIKNGGDHGAENYELDWVQFLPGKRESRRLVGDYVLTAQDLLAARQFPDTVAYGGWPMDIHAQGGISTSEVPTTYYHMDDVYGIPYRCLYSKNIKNLFIGGRAISVSHMAFGSTRVMGTCAVVGQAIGLAAALATQYQCDPRAVGQHITELQQQALKDDLYLPGIKNEDPDDLARQAEITASSWTDGCLPALTVNGVARSVTNEQNYWQAETAEDEWLQYTFEQPRTVQEVRLRFDSNLSQQVMPSLSAGIMAQEAAHVQASLVKDFRVLLLREGKTVASQAIKDNYLRDRVIVFAQPVACDQVVIACDSTQGDAHVRVFEVRLYATKA